MLEHRPAGKAFHMDRALDGAATGPRCLQYERVAVRSAMASGTLVYASCRRGVPMVNHVHISIYPEARLSRIANAILAHHGQEACPT